MKFARPVMIRAFLGIIVFAFLARNIETMLWYGSASLDRAGAMTELPGWTRARMVSRLEELRKTREAGVVVSDASSDMAAYFEAGSLAGRPLFFFTPYLGPYEENGPVNLDNNWAKPLGNSAARASILSVLRAHNQPFYSHATIKGGTWNGKPFFDRFYLDPRLVQAVKQPQHTLLLESLNWTLFNGWPDPGKPRTSISLKPYPSIKNFLIYVGSERSDYGRPHPTMVWRFENDVFDPKRSFEAVGRYLLFFIVNPTPRARLIVDYTATIQADGRNKIPPMSVLAAHRIRMPFAGRGAARLFSPPLRPQLVRGLPFIEIDMGAGGTTFPDHRSGIMKLYGNKYPFDYRKTVGFVRDISLISNDAYRSLRAPSYLSEFPKGLENPNLEFSGIYEDGWIGDQAFLFLFSPKRAHVSIVFRALVPIEAVQKLMQIRITLDGKSVATMRPAAGQLELQINAKGDGDRHKIAIFADPIFHLSGGDERPASIRLQYLGFK